MCLAKAAHPRTVSGQPQRLKPDVIVSGYGTTKSRALPDQRLAISTFPISAFAVVPFPIYAFAISTFPISSLSDPGYAPG